MDNDIVDRGAVRHRKKTYRADFNIICHTAGKRQLSVFDHGVVGHAALNDRHGCKMIIPPFTSM